ncbi:Hsp20/alpha crystallin family protein [Nocardioides sp. CFH 31398]|uniref:Hsp20/alpha crystallin family protein n=1 Tax=Nocardioides sp. CFH 31398 TaxID=2919579 RepID=UPI001F056DED|nr:Hsp20/alpha crystallin family protein [Nocardioides sp. CFH 31398]MCH1866562.1 Hsp20/alpha crystallin family protein [Nocardioides sp. CFH 31398]
MPDRHTNPFDGVADYFSELGRIRSLGTHGTVGGPERGVEAAERTHASAWVPTTDILAVGDDLLIQVELPGVPADEVDLRFHHGVLTVCGARKPDPRLGDAAYYVQERYRGEFRRSITLPDGTEPTQLTAEFVDGLVEITVAGAARESGSTRISVADRSAGATTRPVTAD